MSFSGLLIHELQVYRRSGETDRFGQPVGVNPNQNTTLVATYPCRATPFKGGGLAMNERMIDTFESLFTIHTTTDADVNEDDAVRVVDGEGNVIVPRSKVKSSRIISDGSGPHHVELTAWVQSGPGGPS